MSEEREIAEKLWQLLDDIDTATDMFKPNNNDPFVKYVYKKVSERFDHLSSDGYNLYTKEEFRDKKINDVIDQGSHST